jgi:hypothetical protein
MEYAPGLSSGNPTCFAGNRRDEFPWISHIPASHVW